MGQDGVAVPSRYSASSEMIPDFERVGEHPVHGFNDPIEPRRALYE
jgi:hypothetical protein